MSSISSFSIFKTSSSFCCLICSSSAIRLSCSILNILILFSRYSLFLISPRISWFLMDLCFILLSWSSLAWASFLRYSFFFYCFLISIISCFFWSIRASLRFYRSIYFFRRISAEAYWFSFRLWLSFYCLLCFSCCFSSFFFLRTKTSWAFFFVSSIFFQDFSSSCLRSAILLASNCASCSIYFLAFLTCWRVGWPERYALLMSWFESLW